MATDLTEFYDSFFDDSEDFLREMESHLLALNPQEPARESIDAIFRAIHSIKGGAALFGTFDELSRMAHEVENVLDQVRTDKLALTTEAISVFLSAKDVMAHQIKAYRAGKQVSAVHAMGLSARLNSLQTHSDAIYTEGNDAQFGKEFFHDYASVDLNTNRVRVNSAQIDELMDLADQISAENAFILQACQKLDSKAHSSLLQSADKVNHLLQALKKSAISLRRVSMDSIFGRYEQIVQKTASLLEKQIELHISGGEIEVDKGVAEKVIAPLTHIIRNSLDHGIEPAQERQRKGKAHTGNIYLAAFHQDEQMVIEVTDDGAGLDRERILSKAIDIGLPVDDDMNDSDVFDLIFSPGFSTAQKVTDLSGRGVGMDVVRQSIQKIGGQVQILSVKDKGMTIRITLPLNQSILNNKSIKHQTNLPQLKQLSA